MSKISYYRLDGEEKSTLINSKKLIECFGIEYGKKFLDYNSKKFLDNSFKMGKTFISTLPLKNNEDLLYKDRPPSTIYNKVNQIDIEGNLDKIKQYIHKFEEKYNFPQMQEEEYIEFSKNLMIFYLMYCYNRDYIMIYQHQLHNKKHANNEDERIFYIEDVLKPRIQEFNSVRKDLFEKDGIDFSTFLKKVENNEEKDYLKDFKNDLLYAVNDFSIDIKYNVTSFVDVEKQTLHITSSKIFFLIWHIFVNYVLANVLPEKISFCDYCFCMLENKTKLKHYCKKHKDMGWKNKNK